MAASRRVAPLLRLAVLAGVAGLAAWLERRRPLREPRVDLRARLPANAALALTAGVTSALVVLPVSEGFARLVVRNRLGLLPRLRLPPLPRLLLGTAALDLLYYAWHRANHRVPLLWRFHAVHHVDPALDLTTAPRFHFGEILLSALFRSAQVLVVGRHRGVLDVYELLFLSSVALHHANLDLGEACDRRLRALLVTPRLHGIHHSEVRAEQECNFTSGLTLWDRLFGTYRDDVPQQAVRIGLPAWDAPCWDRPSLLLAQPFRPQPDAFDPSGAASTRRGRPPSPTRSRRSAPHRSRR